MLPDFLPNGTLPPGIHSAPWEIFSAHFSGSLRRRILMTGLLGALQALKSAGCGRVFVDGSFVTSKPEPGEYDACWDVEGVSPDDLDPVFLDFSNGRAAQKQKYLGEFFPAQLPEGASGLRFLDFFQQDRDGRPKGIVRIDLATLATAAESEENP